MTLTTTSLSRRWSALALIVTAQFMVILDVAIVNVALPSIKSDLGFSATSLQWVVSAYAILFGGALLLGGRLADLVGRRRLFIIGLLVFAASSLLCGLAWSEASLIAFRALQGLGGALLAPAALSLLVTTFAEGRERNLALGIYGAASGSGAAVGVLLGGLLTSYLSWSWIFFINVPVGIAAALLAPVLLRESRPGPRPSALRLLGRGDRHRRTDALRVRAHARDERRLGHARNAVAARSVDRAARCVPRRRARARRGRCLPLRIFRSRTLSTANAAMTILGAVTFSEFFVLALYLQEVLHYSAVQSGVAFVGFALTVVVVSNLAQIIVGRVGVPTTLTAGLLMSAASVAYLTRLPVDGHYFWDMFPAFVLGGAGLGLAFVPVDDREPRRRRSRRRGHRIRPRQHEPADRRSDRNRRDDRDRVIVHGPLRRRTRRQCRRARPRLPDFALRSDRAPRHRRRAHRCAASDARPRPGHGASSLGVASGQRGGMTTTASSRREHQLQVAALLDEIEERRRHLQRLKAGGARMAGLRDLKSELEDARMRLLDAVA